MRYELPFALIIGSLFMVPLLSVVFSDSIEGHPESFEPANPNEPGGMKGPDWNSLGTDWKGNADESGHVRVIAWADDGWAREVTNDMRKVLNEGIRGQLNHVFSGFVAELPYELVEETIAMTDSIQFELDREIHTFVSQIQYNSTGADILWNMTDGAGKAIRGNGTVVAVIDTGIDYNHADLGGGFGVGYRVTDGWDWVNNDANPMDDNGHGTHCAGIIGANGTLTGMAPDCEFLAYKVLNSGGTGLLSSAVLAIERAMDPNEDLDTSDHADVISMSLGALGGSEDSASCLAVDAASAIGCIVVVAAGNDGPTFGTVSIPGKARTAITVGSHGATGVLSGFSSRGMSSSLSIKPEISAPGEAIYSTYLYGSYLAMSGTSMATPHVAGAAALISQAKPTWTSEMVKSALVSRANTMNESIWNAGAGKLWVGNISDVVVFSSPAILSGNRTFGSTLGLTITTTETDVNLTTSCADWHELTGNYTLNETTVWHPVGIDAGAVLPATTNPTLAAPSTMTLEITEPSVADPEGYYAGEMTLLNGSMTIRIPYAYAVISVVEIHAYGLDGGEMYDSSGYVWIYDTATNEVTRTYSGIGLGSAPPAYAQLTSGNYVIHTQGHDLYYTYDNTFLLTKEVTVARTTDLNVCIYLTDARKFTLNLTSVSDNPLFIQDLRMYWRHVGLVNLSAHHESTDYSISGPDLFNLPKRKTLYISDTTDTIGISMNAYGYSQPIWDFFESNYDHWYEYISGISTDFEIGASADEHYMMSWEFEAVNSSVNTNLGIEWSDMNVYSVETDIPGTVTNPWLDWGTHRAIGGVAQLYPRRDTGAALEPFFSGLNRTIYVQGVQQLLDYPTYVFNAGRSLANFYEVDWNHSLLTSTSSVYMPDRNYYTPLSPGNETMKVGQGPLWVSAYFNNTATNLWLYLPLLKESEHVVSATVSLPQLNLYRNGGLTAIIQLSEVGSTTPTKRVYTTATPGTYKVVIPAFTTGDVMSTSTSITASWVTPSSDVSPPYVTDFVIDRAFVAGSSVPISITVADDQGIGAVSVDWRNGTEDSWHAVGLTPIGMTYSGSISTLAGTDVIDLRVNVTDVIGNYFTYTMLNVAKEQVSASFALTTTEGGIPDIPYTNSEQTLTLVGSLTSGGAPIHASAGVVLDLTVDGTKVATILDEYMVSGSHTHNGTIMFTWDFNPIDIFSGPGQSKEVVAEFSLGIYEPIVVSFTINSTAGADIPPQITLVSPANASAIVDGTIIDIDIFDEDALTVIYSLNGGAETPLAFPYVIDTTSWADGWNTIGVNATDSNTTSTAEFTFHVDANAPVLSITYPLDLGTIEAGESVTISVTDNNTLSVYWAIDGGFWAEDNPYYGLSTTGWATGWYNATVRAYDVFGHYSEDDVQFLISSDAPLITDSPGTTAAVGVPYVYNATCTAADSGTNTWGLTTNASWLAEYWNDQTHCLVNGTPTDAGWFWANLTVGDLDTGVYVNWSITVSGSVPAPAITSTSILGVTEDFGYSYDANADQGVSWVLVSNATFLSIGPTTGIVSGTPTNEHSARSYFVNVSCSNVNGTDYENYTLQVWNKAPAITSYPDITVTVWTAYSYGANHDDEGVGIPPGNFTGITTNYTDPYVFTESTGAFAFTPIVLGSYWFNITADDLRGVDNSTANQNWTVTVLAGIGPSISTSGGTSSGEDILYSYDADADQAVTWALVSNATFLSVDAATGVVSGTPTNAHAEFSFYLNLTCSNMNGTDYENVSLSIWNDPPTITSTPSTTATAGLAYSYSANHDDEGLGTPPGNFSALATNYTGTYSFTWSTGLLTFTPDSAGGYWFNVTADDQRGVANSTITQNWTVTVSAVVEPDIPGPETVIPSSVHALFSYVLQYDVIYTNDLSNGDIIRWFWQFGDGGTAISKNPNHRYDSSGRFLVSLTVYDSSGGSSMAETVVEVSVDDADSMDYGDWDLPTLKSTSFEINGSFVVGAGVFVFLAGMFVRPLPIITPKGAKMLGIIMMLAGAYLYV